MTDTATTVPSTATPTTSAAEAHATGAAATLDTNEWNPWVVAPDAGFDVRETNGRLALVQLDAQRFLVSSPFRFGEPAVLQMLAAQLVASGVDATEAGRRVDDARTFTPRDENPTDMASVPRFMRWFENTYGPHTLAAIIHDELIVETPNGGALGSDTLSDRFFREMMRCAGVPALKRWVMWAAVALRSRWAAGGHRRLSLCAWLVCAFVGLGCAAAATGEALGVWDAPLGALALTGIAVILPFVSAPLWGKQYGASLIAAIAAIWILPAALLAAVGYLVYQVLERIAGRLGLD